MSTWQEYLTTHRQRILDDYLELVRIPSISSYAESAGDVRLAAEWVARRLTAAGVASVEVLETGGHPVVYGDWLGAPGKPTILLYGHFDVQPADPFEAWDSPPFEPTVRDGRVYGRGASDMKGSVVLMIAAVEAMLKTEGRLPVNVKFFLEGQEEIGSPQVAALLTREKARFAADLAINADGGQWDENTPGLLVGTRGSTGVQIDLRGPNADLHSGLYGGPIANPNHALAALLTSMRGADGRILIEGFYDDVAELTAADRALIASVPFDLEAFKASVGVDGLGGETDFAPLERLWTRPTLEITGMWGGYTGPGSKNVLPAEAHAKVSTRLVPNQDPRKIQELIAAHVARNTPPGITATVVRRDGGAHPYLIPPEHWANQAAAAALETLFGRPPVFFRMGATVPVLELFRTHLGIDSITVGLAGFDEGAHAPNEFFRLSNFDRGIATYGVVLEALAGANRGA